MTKGAILVLVGALTGATGYSILQNSGLAVPAAPEEAVAAMPAGAAPAAAPLQERGYGQPALKDRLAQSFGTVCSTPKGECSVPRAPINSFCSCNGTPGRIVR
ncbi:hypothetical protein [Mangrovicoccus sp. HB161399]|uniref:hypothetical protein n=1 Tax=Mangrovicoccus sp. HB161399 TaxID=2720392 RepID=UPI00155664D4|nr:hypothetical protein [Mangrovicoccus sp. HB161399]